MKFVNLTPHDLNLINEAGEPVLVKASGMLARCAVTTKKVGTVNGIKVNESHFGEIQGLPEPEEGKIFIVSAMILTALHGTREDVLGVSEYIRDTEGKIVGAKALTH
jgi:hypothetical protein